MSKIAINLFPHYPPLSFFFTALQLIINKLLTKTVPFRLQSAFFNYIEILYLRKNHTKMGQSGVEKREKSVQRAI